MDHLKDLSTYLRFKGFINITDALNKLGNDGWEKLKKEYKAKKFICDSWNSRDTKEIGLCENCGRPHKEH